VGRLRAKYMRVYICTLRRCVYVCFCVRSRTYTYRYTNTYVSWVMDTCMRMYVYTYMVKSEVSRLVTGVELE